jgi:hypothetical protein
MALRKLSPTISHALAVIWSEVMGMDTDGERLERFGMISRTLPRPVRKLFVLVFMPVL